LVTNQGKRLCKTPGGQAPATSQKNLHSSRWGGGGDHLPKNRKKAKEGWAGSGRMAKGNTEKEKGSSPPGMARERQRSYNTKRSKEPEAERAAKKGRRTWGVQKLTASSGDGGEEGSRKGTLRGFLLKIRTEKGERTILPPQTKKRECDLGCSQPESRKDLRRRNHGRKNGRTCRE